MSVNLKKDGKLHQGHRERMRSKLINHGENIFQTYELFEMLLYYTIRYRDTNDIAKRLFLKYKTADKIFSSTPDELTAVDGVGAKCAEFISLVGRAQGMLDIRAAACKSTVLDNCDAAGEYLVEKYKDELDYKIMLVLLDNRMSVIKCVTMYESRFDSAKVRPEDFVNQALQNNASAAIIAYNHPYGPDMPMPSERTTNESLTAALNDANIAVPDTYMISGQKFKALKDSRRYKTFMQKIDLSGFYKRRKMGVPIFRSTLDGDKAQADNASSESALAYIKELLSYTMKEPSLSRASEDLAKKCGTLRNIISQPMDSLINIGISLSDAVLLKLVAFLTSRRLIEGVIPKKKYSTEEIKSYLSALFIGADVERIYALLFDSEGALISCEFLGAGSVNSSGFVPRVLFDTAIKRKATAIIIAHNHPGGTTKPSSADVETTAGVMHSLANIGVKLLDHYIVAADECEPIDLTANRQYDNNCLQK